MLCRVDSVLCVLWLSLFLWLFFCCEERSRDRSDLKSKTNQQIFPVTKAGGLKKPVGGVKEARAHQLGGQENKMKGSKKQGRGGGGGQKNLVRG